MLRHKSVLSTIKYIHAVNFKDDDYEIATATTTEEIKQLGQAGFVKYDEKDVSTSTVSLRNSGACNDEKCYLLQ